MILESIKTQYTDENTGFVVKLIKTSEWEHLNHKMAVNNNLFRCEQNRIKNGKSILTVPFQIHHIPFKKKGLMWDFNDMDEAKAHAMRNNRFFFPFQQRSVPQWSHLSFSESEMDFQDLSTRGLSLVPYPIPLDANLEDWKIRKQKAMTLLHPSQTLVPVFCSQHQFDLFEDILNYEFEHSKIISMQCYGLHDANTLANLIKIRMRNMRLQTGDEAPLLIGVNYQKRLKGIASVSGSFAYSCFGFDIFSDRHTVLDNMPPEVVKQILSQGIDEVMKYDRLLGGFNLSAEQQFWDGRNITREFLQNVSLDEGLSQYQAIQWGNFKGQQDDFDVLNQLVLETRTNKNALSDYLNNQKEKWSVFWKTKIAPISI